MRSACLLVHGKVCGGMERMDVFVVGDGYIYI